MHVLTVDLDKCFIERNTETVIVVIFGAGLGVTFLFYAFPML